jgi:hypothetical protein
MTNYLEFTPQNFGVREQQQPDALVSANLSSRFEPTTGQVLGAAAEEALSGTGTLAQDIDAAKIDYELADSGYGPVSLYQRAFGERSESRLLTDDEYKKSSFFRDGLKHEPGLNTEIARIRAESYDEKKERDFVLSRATGGQKALAFGAGLLTGVIEPKNLTVGIMASAATLNPLTGLAVGGARYKAMQMSIGKYKSAAVVGATEGLAGSLLTEPSARESSKTLQQDYTMMDTLLNVGLGVVLGGTIESGVAYVHSRKAGKLPPTIESASIETRGKALDMATSQLTEGRPVNVDIIHESGKIADAPSFSTIPREELEKSLDISNVKETKKGYEIRLDDELGLISGAVGQGKTPEESVANLRAQYGLAAAINKDDAFDANIANTTAKNTKRIEEIDARLAELKNPETSKKIFDAELDRLEFPRERLANMRQSLQEVQQERASLREKLAADTTTDRAYRDFDLETDSLVLSKKSEIQSFIMENDKGKIARASQLIQEDKKILQAQKKSLQQKVYSDRTPENFSKTYDDFVQSAKSPENFGAIDVEASKEIELSNKQIPPAKLDETTMYDQDIADMESSIREMQELGLLDADELQHLDDINNALKEVSGYEKAVDTAAFCLTRG